MQSLPGAATNSARPTASIVPSWLKRALMPLALAMLTGGCSTPSGPVKPPEIQPLPPEARQPTRSESFSESARRDIETWLQKLTSPAPPANSASGTTTR